MVTFLWTVLLPSIGSSAVALCQHSANVGMPAHVDQLILPGSELEVIPLVDRNAPIVVRIKSVHRHGSAHRYNLVYYGLVPGQFNIVDYLRPKDGSSKKGLPEVPIEIKPTLPPGQIEPHRLAPVAAPHLGGYRTLLVLAGIVWLAGLAAILLVGYKRRREQVGQAPRPVSLADRLAPLIDRAMAGTLTQAQQAELERMLLAFWRKRLDLQNMPAAEAIRALRKDEQAGRLIRQLEQWLHAPGQTNNVDLKMLLKPYQYPANSSFIGS